MPLPSDIDRLSRANLSGKLIPQHRALRRFDFPAHRWLSVLLIPIVLDAALWWLRAPIAAAWSWIADFWLALLALPGHCLTIDVTWRTAALPVPSIMLSAAPPTPFIWWLGSALSVLVWPLTKVLPERLTPLKYVLRWCSLVQMTAQIYFWFWPSSFPHTIADISHVEFGAGFALLFLAPWVHALTYHIFDFGWPRKIALSLLSLLYVSLATPLLFTLHAWLIHHLSLIIAPLLYLVFGLLVLIAGLVGLYSWAMSWRVRATEEDAAQPLSN
jgi:hypothetical protein